MNTWLRWYHGTSTDPKWRLIAKKSGVPVIAVLSVWSMILENASQSDTRGTLQNWDDETVATALDLETLQVVSIVSSMQGKVLDGHKLINWNKRNPQRERPEDTSTERVRRHREKRKQDDKSVTPRNAKKRLDKTRLEEIRKEEIREEANIENKSLPIVRPPAEKRGGAPDEAFELFAEKHREKMNSEYVIRSGDFPQLAALRKANHVPARASPDGWDIAVENYFASPVKPSLARLAVDFASYRNSPIDRYGTPINHRNGNHNAKPKENPNDRATKDFLRRALAPEVQSDVPDVREDS